MIFAAEEHVDMIRNGLSHISPVNILYHPGPWRIVKTQTRRVNRGIYQVGRDYAVQRKRGVKAELDIRIVMDRIWEEREVTNTILSYISKENAWAEGGYQPEEYEETFRKLNPKWWGFSRWAFKFHVVDVRRNVPGITSHAREERVKRTLEHLTKDEKLEVLE